MPLIPFWLTCPGSRLGIADRAVAEPVDSLVRLLETTLTDAALALGDYQTARQQSGTNNKAQWMRDRDEKSGLMQGLEAQFGVDPFDHKKLGQLRAEAERQFVERAFAAGRIPKQYPHRMPFLYARTFLSAADTPTGTFDQLATFDIARTAAEAALAAIADAAPSLKHVRDSALHVEERVQGKAYKRKMDLKPASANSPPTQRALMVDILSGDNFGNTIHDGHYAQVPVTAEFFALLVGTVQTFIDTLPWDGEPRVYPYF